MGNQIAKYLQNPVTWLIIAILTILLGMIILYAYLHNEVPLPEEPVEIPLDPSEQETYTETPITYEPYDTTPTIKPIHPSTPLHTPDVPLPEQPQDVTPDPILAPEQPEIELPTTTPIPQPKQVRIEFQATKGNPILRECVPTQSIILAENTLHTAVLPNFVQILVASPPEIEPISIIITANFVGYRLIQENFTFLKPMDSLMLVVEPEPGVVIHHPQDVRIMIMDATQSMTKWDSQDQVLSKLMWESGTCKKGQVFWFAAWTNPFWKSSVWLEQPSLIPQANDMIYIIKADQQKILLTDMDKKMYDGHLSITIP